MGWKQYSRSIQAAGRRAERSAAKRHRELVKQHQSAQRQAARDDASNEVALFENYLELLVSVHKEGGESWDWNSIKAAPQPVPPVRARTRAVEAEQALNAFKPTLMQRLFGGEAKVRSTLEEALKKAAAEDAREYEKAMEAHREAHALWSAEADLAEGVIHENLEAYEKALHYSGMVDELSAFKTRVIFHVVEKDVIALSCVFEDEELVPREEVKLTAAGKLSSKAFPAGKYWALYQDHVCSCALRLARETFGVLPVARVIVNVNMPRLDTSTGHLCTDTILAVGFVRDVVQRLNLADLDPSDSLKNFHHRMKFKKTAGFDAVEPMTFDEQWVST